MGVTIASAETNNELRQALAGLEGVEQIQDDVLIHGKGKQHDERLAKALKRLKERGITLREEKCCWGQPSVKWFGMQFSKQGMSITQRKQKPSDICRHQQIQKA